MISPALIADVQALATAVTQYAPLKQLPRFQMTILRAQAAAVIVEVDAALKAAAGSLDSGDPAGFAGDLVPALLSLADASTDQETLANVRGYVGRAAFNINQVFS